MLQAISNGQRCYTGEDLTSVGFIVCTSTMKMSCTMPAANCISCPAGVQHSYGQRSCKGEDLTGVSLIVCTANTET